jgi:predicted metal-dependent phosphoesterase TrpH
VLIDMHVHTSASDGFDIGLDEVIERLKQRGITGALLAECDVVPDWEAVKAAAERNKFTLFVGVDIDAADGRLIAVPADPTDARFLEQAWRGDDGDTNLALVSRAMEAMGGVVLAAHPYMDDGGPSLGDKIYRSRGIAAIEILCGLKDDLANDLALEAAASLNLPSFGGSDTGPEGERLGHYATAFADAPRTQEDFVAALRDGSFWAVELRRAGTRRSPPRGDRGERGDRRR